MHDPDEPRDIVIILTAQGGVEVLDLSEDDEEGEQLWASDSDEDFREEFPDFVDENDLEHLLDYLVDKEVITDAEAEDADIQSEALTETAAANGPGDEEDDDDDDDDE